MCQNNPLKRQITDQAEVLVSNKRKGPQVLMAVAVFARCDTAPSSLDYPSRVLRRYV
jgi:hypothetical protein